MTTSAIALRHLAFEDLGTLRPLLENRGYAITYLDAGVDEIADHATAITDADLLVVLGGPIGVYEEEAYPFLVDEKRVIADRLQANRATLGICLGAQLIAATLNAEVRSTGKKEIGFSPLTLVSPDSVLAPLAEVPVLHWHGDEFAIPESAGRLAETSGFPNQAFAIGPNVLGLQFHLEVDSARIEQWLIGHANELAQAGIAPRQIRADAAAFGPQLTAAATAVFESWLDDLIEPASPAS